MLYKTIKEACLIVMVAALLAGIVNLVRPDGRSIKEWTILSSSSTPATVETDPTAPGEITIERAVDLYRLKNTLIVDSRSSGEFEAGHIRGAVNLPETAFDEWIGDFVEKTPPETLIITYCAGGSCQLAPKLAEKLIMVGFERVHYLIDGWGKWQAAGMPVDYGPQQNAASD